jgi:hypothetical protein
LQEPSKRAIQANKAALPCPFYGRWVFRILLGFNARVSAFQRLWQHTQLDSVHSSSGDLQGPMASRISPSRLLCVFQSQGWHFARRRSLRSTSAQAETKKRHFSRPPFHDLNCASRTVRTKLCTARSITSFPHQV